MFGLYVGFKRGMLFLRERTNITNPIYLSSGFNNDQYMVNFVHPRCLSQLKGEFFFLFLFHKNVHVKRP